MNSIRAILRIFGFALHIVYWTIRVIISHIFTGQTAKKDQAMRKNWASGLMRILGFQITFHGSPIEETALYVSNHRSFLDPLIMLKDVEAHPISRAEVANWPLIGRGAALTGTIFVQKDNRKSRGQTRKRIYEELMAGNSILIYPEGKTNVSLKTTRFNKGSFNMAVKAGVPVVPVVLEYADTSAYWDHSDPLLIHFIKHFGKRSTNIHVIYGQPVFSDDMWVLLDTCQTWIDQNIIELRQKLDTNASKEKHPRRNRGVPQI